MESTEGDVLAVELLHEHGTVSVSSVKNVRSEGRGGLGRRDLLPLPLAVTS